MVGGYGLLLVFTFDNLLVGVVGGCGLLGVLAVGVVGGCGLLGVLAVGVVS